MGGDEPGPAEVLLEVVERFEQTDLEFMVVGAFAVMAYGRPRTTADIDLSLHLDFAKRDEEVRPLLEEIGSDVEERRDPQWGSRLVATHPSGLEIEVFFTYGHPLYEREFERKRWIEFRGQEVPFTSPEDLVLRKLVNIRKRAGKDWEDAVSVAQVQGERLDVDYLREHCAPHRVCDEVEKLASLAQEAPEEEA